MVESNRPFYLKYSHFFAEGDYYEIKRKKLLIIGGAEIHCKVVRAAKEMGIHTIVVDYLPREKAPAKLIADEDFVLDIYDTDGIIALAKEKKVDGVINTSLDPCQIPQCKVCHALGLPCYGTPEQYFQMTNKTAFKKLCKNNNIEIIEDYSEEEVYNGQAIYPLFIKPVGSRGSRGQSVCYSLEEAKKGIETAKGISTDGTVLIEQYLEGKQGFMLCYIVINSVPHLVRICDRYEGLLKDGLDKVGALAMMPSKYSEMYVNKVHGRVVKMIENLGIKNGPIFLHGFVDGDTVRMYDPRCKTSGGNYENLFKSVTGIDIIKMLIEFSITGSVSEDYGILEEDAYLLNGKYAANLFPMMSAGTIEHIEGFNYIKNMPYTVSAALRHCEGETVEATGTVNQRIGEFNIQTDSILEMKNAIKDVYSHLKVFDKDGNDLVCSKIDIDNLWIG